ncbi:hypothetical protein AAVH_33277, partial [Aphelenchoides avenae]
HSVTGNEAGNLSATFYMSGMPQVPRNSVACDVPTTADVFIMSSSSNMSSRSTLLYKSRASTNSSA